MIDPARGVYVQVRAQFLDDQSIPQQHRFVWAYHIRIHNGGRLTVQLLRRSWEITDSTGRTLRVEGEGVIGEQPVLDPGETFEYTSGTPLETPSGFMVGRYHFVETASGDAFDVPIPAFSLDSPHETGLLH